MSNENHLNGQPEQPNGYTPQRRGEQLPSVGDYPSASGYPPPDEGAHKTSNKNLIIGLVVALVIVALVIAAFIIRNRSADDPVDDPTTAIIPTGVIPDPNSTSSVTVPLPTNTGGAQTAVPRVPSASAELNEPFLLGDWELVVKDQVERVPVIAEGTIYEEQAEGEFLVIPVSVTNIESDEGFFALEGSAAIDSNDVAYPYHSELEAPLSEERGHPLMMTIAQGETFEGFFITDVPTDASITALHVASLFAPSDQIIEIELPGV